MACDRQLRAISLAVVFAVTFIIVFTFTFTGAVVIVITITFLNTPRPTGAKLPLCHSGRSLAADNSLLTSFTIFVTHANIKMC